MTARALGYVHACFGLKPKIVLHPSNKKEYMEGYREGKKYKRDRTRGDSMDKCLITK